MERESDMALEELGEDKELVAGFKLGMAWPLEVPAGSQTGPVVALYVRSLMLPSGDRVEHKFLFEPSNFTELVIEACSVLGDGFLQVVLQSLDNVDFTIIEEN